MVDGIKANEFAYVEKDLEHLLRRRPLSFEKYLSNL
jgi:NAD(P)H dehydrogenase (quinone)